METELCLSVVSVREDILAPVLRLFIFRQHVFGASSSRFVHDINLSSIRTRGLYLFWVTPHRDPNTLEQQREESPPLELPSDTLALLQQFQQEQSSAEDERKALEERMAKASDVDQPGQQPVISVAEFRRLFGMLPFF